MAIQKMSRHWPGGLALLLCTPHREGARIANLIDAIIQHLAVSEDTFPKDSAQTSGHQCRARKT